MTQPGRPALFRDALGGRDGTHAPNLPVAAPRVYWDPTLSTAPRRTVVAPPLPPTPVVIDPSLFIPPASAAAPATARQPRAIPPARPAGRGPAAAPSAIRPAAPVPSAMTAPPQVAWPTPTSSAAWSSPGPTVAAVPGTGYSAPVLPAGPPTPLSVVPPVGRRPETNSQQVLREAMQAFNQRTPNRAANRTQASAKGCVSVIFWVVILIVVGLLFQSGTLSDLLNQFFH